MYDPVKVPAHTLAVLREFRDEKVLNDDPFFIAVLTNDLRGAALYADEDNFEALAHIVGWCYNELPHGSWGSEERVRAWLTSRS